MRADAALLQQQEAYQALLRCGNLEWQVDSLPASSPSGQGQPGGISALAQDTRNGSLPSCIPILRVSPLPAETLASFPSPYRMALILVDGRRSIHEIARLRSRSPDDIQQMLARAPHLVQLLHARIVRDARARCNVPTRNPEHRAVS